jgi:chromosome segregation ATPase
VKGYIGGVLERMLARMDHATAREQALMLELAQIKDQLAAAATRADDARALAEERLALLTAASALADERVALIEAAAARAETAMTHAASLEKQIELERKEHGPAANRTIRLELRVQALKRRCERLQAALCKFQDQLARADVSGRIRELQEEKAQLQQRLADLETYVTFRVEPPQSAANGAEERQGSANPR